MKKIISEKVEDTQAFTLPQMLDGLLVEDLNENIPAKKRIKCGQKGKRGEREIVKIFNTHFAKILSENSKWGCFSRSVGSGNRWGQKVILSETASQIYSGDLTCPDNFKFVVESKFGYNDVDVFTVFSGKCPVLDDFLRQVKDESDRTGRKPMLIWRKDRKCAVAFLKSLDLIQINQDKHGELDELKKCMLYYGDWIGVSLDTLLEETTDSFWFTTVAG